MNAARTRQPQKNKNAFVPVDAGRQPPTLLRSPDSPGSGWSDLRSPTVSLASKKYGCDTKQAAGPYMHVASGSNPAAAPVAAKQAQHLVGSQGIGSAAAAAPCAAAKTLNGTTMNCKEAEAIR